MKIITVPVGYLKANCYILNKKDENIIIDPGDEYDKIIQNIKGKVVATLITHSHFDHIGALDKIVKRFNCPIYDFKNLEEKEYKISDFIFEVIYTKGHTSDSVSYYFKESNALFTGDFLFKESIGRTDLETGNMNEMFKSIDKIIKYNDVIIYPGHGEKTTLEYEKKHNPYLIK